MYSRILVPTDGSATANLALKEAIDLACHHQARLRLMHVVDKLIFTPTVETAKYMAEMQTALRKEGKAIVAKAQTLARKSGLAVDAVLPEIVGGRVAEAIVAEAKKWRAELIVMGTHGRRGVNRLMMGSDAEQVIRTAPVPVLVVRTRAAGR